MDNISKSHINIEAFSDVKKFLLMYYKITGVGIVVSLYVAYAKSYVSTAILIFLLYVAWIITLWLIYKYFRKNKSTMAIFMLTVLAFPFGFIFPACYENVKEQENEKEKIAFNEVRDFLLLYFMITGTLMVAGYILSYNKPQNWIMPNIFILLPLYTAWMTMLWIIYRDFRKKRNMLNYISLIILTLPYGLIMISCYPKLKEVNKDKYIQEK